MQGAAAEMIPAIGLKLIHRDLEEKPDYDGEMRELSVDAVIELDVRLYEEQELELPCRFRIRQENLLFLRKE